MSEQDETRVKANAVRLRFRLGGLTAAEVTEAQNWLATAAKALRPSGLSRMLARHELEPIPPEREAKLRRRFHLDDPEPGGEA